MAVEQSSQLGYSLEVSRVSILAKGTSGGIGLLLAALLRYVVRDLFSTGAG
ncbi:MAG: hypothetical protein WAK20_03995 [Candidatus Acidiferrum sp.]